MRRLFQRLLSTLGSWGTGIPSVLGGRKARIRRILADMQCNDGHFAEKAVEEAIANRHVITPHLLRIVAETTRDAETAAKEERYIAHLYAIHLLAQFRETRAYRPIIELLRLPGELPENLLADTITERIENILASVYDGDIRPLADLIEDSKANEWSRAGGVRALKAMVYNGILARDKAIDYLRHLFRGGLEKKPSQVWNEAVSTANELHPGELIEDIRKAFEDELVDEDWRDLDDTERCLHRSREAVMEEHREAVGYLVEDVASEMAWWACFDADEHEDDSDEEEPAEEEDEWDEEDDDEDLEDHLAPGNYVRATPKIGRNDPCPCCSGKKYKKCCLDRDARQGRG